MTSTPRIDDANTQLLEDLNMELDKLTFGAGADRQGRRPHARGEPRFHTILACVDLTAGAQNVVAWAREIALAHRARVIVASVVQPAIPASGLAAVYGVSTGMQEARVAAEGRARRRVDEAIRDLEAAGIETDAVVTSGSIARSLADVAETHHADLVIVGSHGGGSVSRVALGSTGNFILDRVGASVLIARTAPPIRKILTPTDGSSASYRAVAYALKEAEQSDADIVVQHVLELPEDADQVPSQGLLQSVITRMQLKRSPRLSYLLDAGKPADRILAKAEELGVDLIVMGSRGLGNLRGILLGSVSHRVANAARASVLVVKDGHHGR